MPSIEPLPWGPAVSGTLGGVVAADGDTDFSAHSLSQVKEGLRNIDRAKFPENFQRLTARLAELEASSTAESIVQSDNDPKTGTKAGGDPVPDIQSIHFQRLKTGSVFRLVAAGISFSFVPFAAFMGFFSYFGFKTITWNDEAVLGLKGLVFAPFIGLFAAALFTAFLGSFIALGLLLYSKWRPLTLEFVPRKEEE